MMTPEPQSQSHNQRRSHYIDGRIQGRLLAAILVFEAVLFAVAMVILYWDLNQVIEDQLYRIHLGPQEGLPVLVTELLRVAPSIVIANILVIVAIDWVWLNYVAKIVLSLKTALQSATFLDLRLRPAPVVDHEVLEKAGDWIQKERLRCAQLLQLAEELNVDMDTARIRRVVLEMRKCLPS